MFKCTLKLSKKTIRHKLTRYFYNNITIDEDWYYGKHLQY